MRTHKVEVVLPWLARGSKPIAFQAEYDEAYEADRRQDDMSATRTYRTDNGCFFNVTTYALSAIPAIEDKTVSDYILAAWTRRFNTLHDEHERSLDQFRPQTVYQHSVVGIAGFNGYTRLSNRER